MEGNTLPFFHPTVQPPIAYTVGKSLKRNIMKTLVANRNLFTLMLLFLLALFFLVGCGESEQNNSRPVIQAIPNQTLDVGVTLEVEVRVTDADVEDTHTINASSDDTTVATVSVDGTILTITGKAAGTATITVTATDNSGQENAEGTSVTFKVTGNDPPPVCKVGMIIEKGGSCTHPGNGEKFSVDTDGKGHFLFITAGKGINISAANITFSANQRNDGSWEILDVGD